MKSLWRIALLSLLASCVLPLGAAQNSQALVLPVDVRMGDLNIPQGHYQVTWTQPSGPRVRLTLTADGKKPITIPARRIVETHRTAGVTTFEEDGVTYLQDFHTTQETFIIPGTPSPPK